MHAGEHLQAGCDGEGAAQEAPCTCAGAKHVDLPKLRFLHQAQGRGSAPRYGDGKPCSATLLCSALISKLISRSVMSCMVPKPPIRQFKKEQKKLTASLKVSGKVAEIECFPLVGVKEVVLVGAADLHVQGLVNDINQYPPRFTMGLSPSSKPWHCCYGGNTWPWYCIGR